MGLGDGLRGVGKKRRSQAGSLQERANGVVSVTAKRIQDTAKAVAPVQTGNLRDSIVVSTANGGSRAAVVATASYAGYVEHGTSRVAPQPFMSTATEQHRGEFIDMVKEVIQ